MKIALKDLPQPLLLLQPFPPYFFSVFTAMTYLLLLRTLKGIFCFFFPRNENMSPPRKGQKWRTEMEWIGMIMNGKVTNRLGLGERHLKGERNCKGGNMKS